MIRGLWQNVDTYRLINAFLGAFVGMLGVVLAVWLVVALVLGTAEIVEMAR
jgi:hypothetical protein